MTEIKAVIFDWFGTLINKETRSLFPYSKQVLQELKNRGYELSLISLALTKEKRLAEIKESGISHYFSNIFVGTVKNPEQYMQCINLMNSSPGLTAIVDDRISRSSIIIGNQLGCKTFLIDNGFYERMVPIAETGEPTYKIKSVEDLLNIL